MSFLNKIDDIYRTTREAFDIQEENTLFSCFIPVEPLDCETTSQFVIKKQEKAKLLLVSGKQRVYISDLQIINTILDMDHDDIEWFLHQFVALYTGVMCAVRFAINGEAFNGCGIEHYPRKKQVILFSDTSVEINDFIFILNFVFSKDKCWEEMIEQEEFSKRTLCKYIALVDYYAKATPRSKDFLKAIEYPIESPHPVDDKKTKNIFNRTEKFDISLYG